MKRTKDTILFAIYQVLDFFEELRTEDPKPEFERIGAMWSDVGDNVSITAEYENKEDMRITFPADNLDEVIETVEHIKEDLGME